MSYKDSKTILKNRAKILCVMWEALRRNPDYKSDYKRYRTHCQKIGLSDYITIDGSRADGPDKIELVEKWGVLLNPEMNLSKFLRPKASLSLSEARRIVNLLRKPAVSCSEHEMLLPPKPMWRIRMPEPIRGKKIKKARLEKRSISSWDHKKCHFKIDLSRKKEDIFPELEDFFAALKKFIKVRENKVFKIGAYDAQAFKVFDAVDKMRKNQKKLNWTKLAGNREQDDFADSSDRGKEAKRAYQRAEKLINGGFRHLQ